MFGWQFGPEKVIGLTRNTNPYGTTMVDPSTLQAAAHAASNACIAYYMDKLKNNNLAKEKKKKKEHIL